MGPLDIIVYNAGKNFALAEFRQLAQSIAIELKDEPISKDMILQMAIKAVNDSVGPNGLVPTLLVFGAYLRLTDLDPLSPSIIKRAKALRIATKEVRCIHAQRKVKDALAMRNGPNTLLTLNLLLQSDVRVWREKGG